MGVILVKNIYAAVFFLCFVYKPPTVRVKNTSLKSVFNILNGFCQCAWFFPCGTGLCRGPYGCSQETELSGKNNKNNKNKKTHSTHVQKDWLVAAVVHSFLQGFWLHRVGKVCVSLWSHSQRPSAYGYLLGDQLKETQIFLSQCWNFVKKNDNKQAA